MLRTWAVFALAAAPLLGCTINPDNGGTFRPIDQPVAIVKVGTNSHALADCVFRQLDARYSPVVYRTRPATGADEIIYLGGGGARQWEMTISPDGGDRSTVTFRSMNTIRGHDVFWREIEPQRAACGII